MNVKDYIESGILEAYVMGTLPLDEQKQVNQLIEAYPELVKEVEEIESALLKVKKPLSKNLLPEIFDTIEALEAEESESVQSTEPILSISSVWYRNFAAAVTLFLVSSIGLNLYFYGQLSKKSEKIKALQSEKTFLADRYETIKAFNQSQADQLTVITNVDQKIVHLKSVNNNSKISATVFWNSKTKAVNISTAGLSALPSNKQYQLWALKDGIPESVGLIQSGKDFQELLDVESADAFAITVEPVGGSTSPTLEKMVVMSEV